FSNAPPPPDIYTLSLHDALPISSRSVDVIADWLIRSDRRPGRAASRERRPRVRQPGSLAGERGQVPGSDSTGPVIRRVSRVSRLDRKSTRLNSSHSQISYAVFCL